MLNMYLWRRIMVFKVIDLDKDENLVIVVTYNGKTRSLSKPELLELLENRQEPLPLGSARSLASIGKILGIMRRDRLDALTADDCQRIEAALDSFSGETGRKRSSQVGRWLREMLAWKSATMNLKTKIKVFLKTYPQLEVIPERKAKEEPTGGKLP
jgi:hypothetical protein